MKGLKMNSVRLHGTRTKAFIMKNAKRQQRHTLKIFARDAVK